MHVVQEVHTGMPFPVAIRGGYLSNPTEAGRYPRMEIEGNQCHQGLFVWPRTSEKCGQRPPISQVQRKSQGPT
ncbi:hypothetical protein M408DRAFT_332677 [Serendipita vermifera MAFF 305830]|uniref:Uncharacterized protein n=1 Tax=Serendipita vermifera MAFF 305830 TaxID=933852 RepID=A0A0C2W8X7_SERVB|nr:hypothetical protein M408DRAFT_332677 [Serendipita vermifera MAFF 305830]